MAKRVMHIRGMIPLKKPDDWSDGSLEAQEKLFNHITTRFIWLTVREYLDGGATLFENAEKKWTDNYAITLERSWSTIGNVFEECLRQFEFTDGEKYEPTLEEYTHLSKELYLCKNLVENYATVYELLEYVTILEDRYRVYEYD